MKTKSQFCLSVLAIVAVFTAGCRNIVIEGQFFVPADVTATALATSNRTTPSSTPDLSATAAIERAVRLTLTAAAPAPTHTPAPSPGAFLIAFPENEAVEGWEWPEGAAVHLAIDDLTTAASPDFERDGIMGAAPREEDSRTYVRIDFTGEYDLKVGDLVTVTDGATGRTHVVRNLSVMGVDAASDTVAGMADPGAPVDVWPHGFTPAALVQMNSGDDGAWLADFDGLFDLVAGTSGRSWILDEVGNATAVDWTALAPSVWRDEFNGSLGEGWHWVNENPAMWNLREQPGFLRLYNAHAGIGNLLLRSVAEGDFALETHLLFEPDANFQFAGLVIYQDDKNDLAFGRAFCDTPKVCVGNGIYFDYFGGGAWVGGNFGTPVGNPSEAYLRLERRGQMVKAFYSDEGMTWFEIGTHRLPSDFRVNGVGLMAAGDYDTSDPDIPADFDYFELTEGR
jgi:regulation of enolase protein 1 (concanavalin A-like superfamily)